MAPFDSKTALNHAIRYLADAAQKRAAGGWIPPKEQERQQRDAMRQEQQQARQAEKQQQAQQKQFIADEKERQKNLAAFQKGNDPLVPHVVYHGTAYPNISSFEGYRGSAGHFAFDPEIAAGFARSVGKKEKENFEEEKTLGNSDAKLVNFQQIYPVHISAKRVFDARDPEHRKLIEGGEDLPWDYYDLENNRKDIQKAGFDAYLDFENGIHEEPQGIAVFYPHQIKSATGNSGHFDPSNPDITKSEGGLILSKQFPTHYMPEVGRQVMASGGKTKKHPALSIAGTHIREEEHGEPIFTGRL